MSTLILFNPFGGGNILTEAQCETLARGAARLRYTHNGEIRSYRLNSQERERYENAQQRGYISCSSRKRPARDKPHGLFWLWCEATQNPYVVIKVGPKFATVSMDLISIRSPIDGHARRDRFDQLWKDQQQPPLGTLRSYGTFTLIERVPVSEASICAEWLLFLWQKTAIASTAR